MALLRQSECGEVNLALARAATPADADGLREPGRFSARRKTETILRTLRGGPSTAWRASWG